MAYDPLGNISNLANRQQQPVAIPKQQGLLQSILSSVISPLAKYGGETIGATGASLLGLGANAFGKNKLPFGLSGNYSGEDYANALNQGVQEKFSNSPVAKAGKGNTGGALMEILKQSAAPASYAVPFGKGIEGANIGVNALTKVLAPGAAVGGLQAVSEGQDPLTGAAAGAAGAGVLQGALNLPGLLSKGANKVVGGAEKAGQSLLSSQYDLSRPVGRGLKLQNTVGKLAKYGITNLEDVVPAAEFVTGADGVVSKGVRTAVAAAGNVDTKGILTIAKDYAANPAMQGNSGDKFVKYINKAVEQVLGGNKGSLNGANPSETYGLIQQLQTEAAGLVRGRNPISISSQDKALSKAFNGIAGELEDRLFKGSGANDALLSKNVLQQIADEVAPQYPKLAKDILKATTVRELRSLQEPFVKGSQAVAETLAGEQSAGKSLGGAFKGLGKIFNQGITGPIGYALDAATPKVGAALNAVGQAGLPTMQGELNPLLQSILGQGGARLGGQIANQSQQQPQEGVQGQTNDIYANDPQSYSNQFAPSIPQQSQGLSLQDFLALSAANPQGASIFKDLYEQGQKANQAPQQKNLAPTAANYINLANNGLADLDSLKNLLSSDSNTLIKTLFPGRLLTREYDSTASRIASNILRIESGANAPEKEVQRYVNDYLPKLGDDQKTINSKLNAVKRKLNGVLQLQSSTTGGDVNSLMQYLGQ
jgi:hypothetical protein